MWNGAGPPPGPLYFTHPSVIVPLHCWTSSKFASAGVCASKFTGFV